MWPKATRLESSSAIRTITTPPVLVARRHQALWPSGWSNNSPLSPLFALFGCPSDPSFFVDTVLVRNILRTPPIYPSTDDRAPGRAPLLPIDYLSCLSPCRLRYLTTTTNWPVSLPPRPPLHLLFVFLFLLLSFFSSSSPPPLSPHFLFGPFYVLTLISKTSS